MTNTIFSLTKDVKIKWKVNKDSSSARERLSQNENTAFVLLLTDDKTKRKLYEPDDFLNFPL